MPLPKVYEVSFKSKEAESIPLRLITIILPYADRGLLETRFDAACRADDVSILCVFTL